MYWLADAFDDGGLEFAAVGAAEVELVAGKADWDGFAWAPFAGGVAVGRVWFVFAGVDDTLHIDNDGASNRVNREFADDFGFGLEPVFGVVASEASAALKEFGSAAANRFLHLRRIFAEQLPHAGRPQM